MRTFLLLLGLLAAPLAADTSKTLAPILEAFRAGRIAQVPALADAVARTDPAFSRARFLAGEAQLLLRKPELARAAFAAALKPDGSGPAPARIGMARALIQLGKATEAESALRTVIAEQPKNADAHAWLGQALLGQKKVQPGVDAMMKAHTLDPKNADQARFLVRLLLSQRKHSDALAVCKRLIEHGGDKALPHFLHGLTLEAARRSNEAIKAYDAAIARDELLLDAHKNVAILCHSFNSGLRDAKLTRKAHSHLTRYFRFGGRDKRLVDLYRVLQSAMKRTAKKTH